MQTESNRRRTVTRIGLIADSSSLTAYAVLVFEVQLILWLILGSWGLISTRLRLGDLIGQSGEVLDRESDSAEQLINHNQMNEEK